MAPPITVYKIDKEYIYRNFVRFTAPVTAIFYCCCVHNNHLFIGGSNNTILRISPGRDRVDVINPGGGTIKAMASNGGRLFISSVAGISIRYTDDNGDTWNVVPNSVLARESVAMACDDQGTVLVSCNFDGVISGDNGGSFSPIGLSGASSDFAGSLRWWKDIGWINRRAQMLRIASTAGGLANPSSQIIVPQLLGHGVVARLGNKFFTSNSIGDRGIYAINSWSPSGVVLLPNQFWRQVGGAINVTVYSMCELQKTPPIIYAFNRDSRAMASYDGVSFKDASNVGLSIINDSVQWGNEVWAVGESSQIVRTLIE